MTARIETAINKIDNVNKEMDKHLTELEQTVAKQQKLLEEINEKLRELIVNGS